MKKPILVKTELDQPIAKLVGKSDHRTLGIWADDCARRVLPYFEKKYPKDKRPRQALDALRLWIKTGEFKMAGVRKDSLAAHAAARAVRGGDDAAKSAARAAGQALATAHVPTHAIVAAIYSASAIRDTSDSIEAAVKEREWQYKHLQSLNNKFSHNRTTKDSLWRSKTGHENSKVKKIATVDEYIKLFDIKTQNILLKIRSIIKKCTPEATEIISYGIPTYKLRENLVHFAAYKNHIGFYPTSSGIKKFHKDISTYEYSRGSVKFPINNAIPYDLIKKITKFRIKEVNSKS